MKRILIIPAILTLAATLGVAEEGTRRIYVFVKAADVPPSGTFTDAEDLEAYERTKKDLADSTKDIRKIIEKGKILALAATEGEALLTLVVVRRSREATGYLTQNEWSGSAEATRPSILVDVYVDGTLVRLVEGTTDATGGGPWTHAAKDVVKQVEEFAKLNFPP